MNAEEVLQQLRHFLLALTILLFVGALAELWLVGHTEDAVQWIPFVLAIGGAIITGLFYLRPNQLMSRVLRIWMVLVMLGSGLGIYFHFKGNYGFEREITPRAGTMDLMWKALEGGNPLLAPGVLAVAGVLAIAATYRYAATSSASQTATTKTINPS